MRLFAAASSSWPIRVLTSDGEFHSARRQFARWEEAGSATVERVPAEPFDDFSDRYFERAQSGEHDFIFESMLRNLRERRRGYVLHQQVSSRDGRIAPEALDTLCPDWRDRAAYACGPAEFLDAAESLWNREEGQLRVERFAPALQAGAGGEGGLVTFEKSDQEVEVDGTITLLEAGEGAGVAMPYGCRMGICRSCLVPLRAGQIRDLRTGEVHGEPGELVQTCISGAAGPVNLDI